MGSKGSSPPPIPQHVYTDPVNGKSFTDDPSVSDGIFRPDDPAGANTITHYRSGSDKLNEEITQREAGEINTSQKTIDDANAAKDKAESDYQTRFGNAKTAATKSIDDYFTSQGVDPNKYADQIADKINSVAGTVGDLDPAPGSKFAPSLSSDLYNEITSGVQSQNLAGYNKVFDPSYSLTHLSDDMINPAVSNVVNQQFDPLSGELLNAQKRGTLNDAGYDAALKAYTTAKTGATSTVGGLATGVLNKDRGDLDQYLGTGRDLAGKAPLNTQFSPDPFVAGANSRVALDQANFGGDVQNAVGNTKFTDLATLLNAGGMAQGATNPSATNPAAGPGGSLSPTAIAQAALANDPRGLGTKGQY